MLSIKLDSLVTEHDSGKMIDNGAGWIEWRSLKLTDTSNDSPVAEWFYVAACNQYYFDKVASNEDSGKGYYIQEEFDEDVLLESVKADFDSLTFNDWDDFHSKMPEYFIHDESD